MELDELLKLIRAVSDSELTGFKYEAEGVCLNLKKEKEVVTAVQTVPAAGVSQSVMPMQTAAASAMSVASADSEEKAAGTKPAEQEGFLVKSPLKLMNDIESDFDGTVAEILVENGEMVEYGQPLFRIA